MVSSGTAWADQQYIGAGYLGGNDTITGANNQADGYTAYGDAQELTPGGRGGNDVFIGGSNSGVPDASTVEATIDEDSYGEDVVFAGDALFMATGTIGGADLITGGNNSSNVFAGDALAAAYGNARGGNDTIQGGHGVAGGVSNNLIFGDARSFGDPPGGDDEISILPASAAVIGGNDSLTGGSGANGATVYNSILGDAGYLTGTSVGGADIIRGGHSATNAFISNLLLGDGFQLGDESTGGSDTITGGSAASGGDVTNIGVGDGWLATGPALGGNDVIIGGGATGAGSSVSNVLTGDILFFVDPDGTLGVMGHDRIVGGNANGAGSGVTNFLSGDTYISEATGGTMGNDTIVGGLSSNGGSMTNSMIGDGLYLDQGQTGGHDRLQAGNKGTLNAMFGDAVIVNGDFATGGNDTLIGGAGVDVMYGDWVIGEGTGGADLFVFRFGNGSDTIGDFRAADGDRIDLSAMKWHPHFKDYATFAAKGRIEDGDDEVILHLSSGSASSDNNIVVLAGLEPSDLSAASFIF